jgi:vanillate O-demethylase ferredoxin subunit
MTDASMSLLVRTMRQEAEGVVSLELVDREGGALPPFEAGGHIDLHLANGHVRSYSLLGDPSDSHRYRVAVLHEAQGRGGSAFIHTALRVGDLVSVSAPRNNFPLAAAATHHVFFAGGIGVTPFLAMARQLNAEGRPWALFYGARSRARAAFADTLARLAAARCGKLTVRFDDEAGGGPFDLQALMSGQPDAAFYCCGPKPMLDAFSRAAEALGVERAHVEHFAGVEAPADGGGYAVVLARDNRRIPVLPGQTILAALRAAGVEVMSSCEEGICGACETKVLAGEPDHRDLVLTPAEHAANSSMMICCSGSKSAELVLDL